MTQYWDPENSGQGELRDGMIDVRITAWRQWESVEFTASIHVPESFADEPDAREAIERRLRQRLNEKILEWFFESAQSVISWGDR